MEFTAKLVVNISILKNESNSQLILQKHYYYFLVVNISILKNESNSQHVNIISLFSYPCCKYQYFKERKQFTTYLLLVLLAYCLL